MEHLCGRAGIEHSPAEFETERVLAIQVFNDVIWILNMLPKRHLFPGCIWATFLLHSGQHTSQPQHQLVIIIWGVVWRMVGSIDTHRSPGNASICSCGTMNSRHLMRKYDV
jgi:hypothetical protein